MAYFIKRYWKMFLLVFAAGCASGIIGIRPEITNAADGGEGRNIISLSFDIRDEDLTEGSVQVEYSTDGTSWHPVSLSNASPGTVRGNTINNIKLADTWKSCSVSWDSWADHVGTDGETDVTLRFTPSDNDGDGEPCELTFSVNNHYPELTVEETAVTFDYGVESRSNAPDQTIHIKNTGPSGTVLSWSTSITYGPEGTGWLSASPDTGTLNSGDTDAVVLSADSVGQGLSAGTYTATVTVSDPAAHKSPAEVEITLIVQPPQPDIFIHDGTETEVTDLYFQCLEGESPPDQSIWIKNSGDPGTVLAWSASDTAAWLSYTPAQGDINQGTSTEVTVSVNGSGLSAGSYTETITVTGSEKTSGLPTISGDKTVVIHLTVIERAAIVCSPASFIFQAEINEANPADQTLYISNAGEAELNWSAADNAAWLTLDPASGTTTTETDEVTLSVDITGLSVGLYSATITVTDPEASNSPQTVDVELCILEPEITLFPESLSFTAIVDGSNPASKTFGITNTGGIGTTLEWTASENTSWLDISPLSGTTTDETDTVTVTVDITGLAEDTYTAYITVSDPDASNSPETVSVTLRVTSDTLVAHWKFDEGSGSVATDSSGNGNHGTLSGPTWTTGVIGGALDFDGTDDGITVPNDDSLNMTSEITIAAWVKPDTWESKNARILQKGGSDNQYLFVAQTYDNPDGIFCCLEDVTPSCIRADLPFPWTWHHFAATYDGVTQKLYIDGALVAEEPSSGNIGVTSDSLFIGTKYIGAPVRDHIDAKLDDIRIYNSALNQDQIRELFFMGGGGIPEIPDGAVLYMTFDSDTIVPDGSDTIVQDLSGNMNHAVISGDPAIVTGIKDDALDFDGVDDSLCASYDSSLRVTGDATVGFWFNADNFAGDPRVVIFGAEGESLETNVAYGVVFTNSGYVEVQHEYGSGSNAFYSIPDYTVTTNTWHHIAVVRDDAQMEYSVYMDGGKIKDVSYSNSPEGSTSGQLWIASWIGTMNQYDGRIDELTIYNRALTKKEITTLYRHAAPTIWVSEFGDDTDGDGSEANPYRNVYMGLSAAKAGNVVWVKPGIYIGELAIGHDNVTLISTTGRDATILDCGGVSSGHMLGVYQHSNVTIDGFFMRGHFTAINADHAHNFTLKNCRFDDFGHCQVYARYTTGGLTVVGNESYNGHHSGSGGSDPAFITIRRSEGTEPILIANNLISYASDNPIVMGSDSNPNIVVANNTIVDSRIGLCIGGQGTHILLINNTVSGCDIGIYNDSNSPPQIKNCNVFNCNNNYWGIDDQTGINGNISADPQFVDESGGDFRIGSSSPCRNTGDNNVPGLPSEDIRGKTRIVDSTVDMGCYERQADDP